MVDNTIRKYLADNYPDVIILDDPAFDNSIVGISNDDRLIYDLNKMCEELAIDDNISIEEARDYIDFNTLRAVPYMPEGRPILLVTTLEE